MQARSCASGAGSIPRGGSWEACESIKGRVRVAHFLRLIARGLDLNEGSFADSRTIGGRFAPRAAAIDKLGPEGEDAALRGLGLVNRTAAVAEKMTVGRGGNPQPRLILRAVDVFPFEAFRRYAEKRCHAADVRVV